MIIQLLTSITHHKQIPGITKAHKLTEYEQKSFHAVFSVSRARRQAAVLDTSLTPNPAPVLSTLIQFAFFSLPKCHPSSNHMTSFLCPLHSMFYIASIIF